MKRNILKFVGFACMAFLLAGCGKKDIIMDSWQAIAVCDDGEYQSTDGISFRAKFTKDQQFVFAVDEIETVGKWEAVPTTISDIENMYKLTIDDSDTRAYIKKNSSSTLVIEMDNSEVLFTKDGICKDHVFQEATCGVPKTCMICSKTEGSPTNAHEWKEATCTTPKTCRVCEKTEGELSADAHKWKEATCKAPATCQLCGKTKGSVLQHEWEDATCTHPKRCVYCREQVDNILLDHQYEETEIYVEADAMDDGVHELTCKMCGDTKIEEIPHLQIKGKGKRFNLKLEHLEWALELATNEDASRIDSDKDTDVCIYRYGDVNREYTFTSYVDVYVDSEGYVTKIECYEYDYAFVPEDASDIMGDLLRYILESEDFYRYDSDHPFAYYLNRYEGPIVWENLNIRCVEEQLESRFEDYHSCVIRLEPF